jgi:hypothetical protein
MLGAARTWIHRGNQLEVCKKSQRVLDMDDNENLSCCWLAWETRPE